jgi:hypothetical protein
MKNACATVRQNIFTATKPTRKFAKVAKIAQYRDRVPFGLKLKLSTATKRPVYHNITNYEDIELV